MALPRQKFREIVFQLLYSQDFFNTESDQMINLMMKQVKTSKKNVHQAYEYMQKITKEINTIDSYIKNTSSSYDFDRISKAELNIIRLGIYEMLFDKDIPAKVAIAEAMRLTKKFGTPESVSFVNAILDSIYKKNED